MRITEMSVELLDYMGSDLSVVNAARVSFAKESDWEYPIVEGYADYEGGGHLSEKDQKLIKYLATHNHWTPFAHNSLSFRIKAPIFVARQLVKHQVGGVWNEVSRRYVDDEPEFWMPKVWRGKPVNAKQGSNGLVYLQSDSDSWTFRNNYWMPEDVVECCIAGYNRMLSLGITPEQARMILPQNTMTEWIWTGSLAFFARVCKLRLDPHAQQETQEIAQKISLEIPDEFEHSWKALMQ